MEARLPLLAPLSRAAPSPVSCPACCPDIDSDPSSPSNIFLCVDEAAKPPHQHTKRLFILTHFRAVHMASTYAIWYNQKYHVAGISEYGQDYRAHGAEEY